MSTRLTREDKVLLFLVVGTVILMNVPYGEYPLYPFKLFSTWIHETFHGITTALTGSTVDRVEIYANTAGVTIWHGSPGTASRALVASMGYMGTAVVGAILLSLRRHLKAQRFALGVIALGMLLTVVFWVRNAFGVATVAVLAGAIGLLALRANDRWAAIATNVLASQACVNALLDIKVLYSVTGHSDAATMSRVVGLWPWFWASLWLALSGLLFWFAWTRARQKPPLKTPPQAPPQVPPQAPPESSL